MFKPLSTIILFSLITSSIIAQNKIDVTKYPLYPINKNASLQLVFYVSGDGGWNSFSQKLCAELSQKGYALVCLDSRKYFWEQKTPEKFSQEASDIIEHYLKAWNKEEFSIVGYSFGADAAAFLANRISKSLQPKLKSAVLLIPSSDTDMVVKVSDMFGFGSKNGKYKVLPEINKIQSPLLCIFAQDDENELESLIKEKNELKKLKLPGSHKFDNETKKVAQSVASGLN